MDDMLACMVRLQLHALLPPNFACCGEGWRLRTVRLGNGGFWADCKVMIPSIEG
jgi:hypothetical protein